MIPVMTYMTCVSLVLYQALGCVLYTLCFISHPFQDAGNLGILGGMVKMPETTAISEPARQLIQLMFDVSLLNS